MRVDPDNQVHAEGAEDFDALYRGEDRDGVSIGAVWDTGRVQPCVTRWESYGLISSPVLDVGCGSGANAVFLASQGYQVTGVDFSVAALELARERAQRNGEEVTWIEDDVTRLERVTEEGPFNTVVDSALYHCLPPTRRLAYLEAVSKVSQTGTRLLMACFANTAPKGLPGPLRISRSELERLLPSFGWSVSQITPTTYQTRASIEEMQALAEAGGTPLGDLPDKDAEGFFPLPVWEVQARRI